jgi:hypothetical protein
MTNRKGSANHCAVHDLQCGVRGKSKQKAEREEITKEQKSRKSSAMLEKKGYKTTMHANV